MGGRVLELSGLIEEEEFGARRRLHQGGLEPYPTAFLKKNLSFLTANSILLSLFPWRSSGIISLKNRILLMRRSVGVS